MDELTLAAINRVALLEPTEAKAEFVRFLTELRLQGKPFDVDYVDTGCPCCSPTLERSPSDKYGDYMDADVVRSLITKIA